MNKLKAENEALRNVAATFAGLVAQFMRATEHDFPDPDSRPAEIDKAYKAASDWLLDNTNFPLRRRL